MQIENLIAFALTYAAAFYAIKGAKMKRISSLYDLSNFVYNRHNKAEVARFFTCSAYIKKYAGEIISLISYRTEILRYDFTRGICLKISGVQTNTTLYHLRKFFDLVASRSKYYDFKELKIGGFLYDC